MEKISGTDIIRNRLVLRRLVNEMRNFFLTGQLDLVKIGMPISEVFSVLGKSEDMGTGTGGWRIEAYSGRSLQIGHHSGLVGLIGIYFMPKALEPPILPPATKCKVPFTCLTTRDEFKTYLKANQIPWELDSRLPDAVSFKIGMGIIASFDENLLYNLVVSG